MANAPKINIKNRRASFDYEIEERLVAGIVLVGTEIKSIRGGHASLVDSFCYFSNGELWVKNLRIAEYFYAKYFNHNPLRDRKLLLNKKEIFKWEKRVKEAGFTVVPLRLFINDKGLAKLEIGLCRGKKQFDKRETIKNRDSKRDLDRVKKYF